MSPAPSPRIDPVLGEILETHSPLPCRGARMLPTFSDAPDARQVHSVVGEGKHLYDVGQEHPVDQDVAGTPARLADVVGPCARSNLRAPLADLGVKRGRGALRESASRTRRTFEHRSASA